MVRKFFKGQYILFGFCMEDFIRSEKIWRLLNNKKMDPAEKLLKIAELTGSTDDGLGRIREEGEERRKAAGIKEGEHVKATVTQHTPKTLKEKTEKYMNSPYYYSLLDAFRKAAGEMKNPSKKLKDAIAKDDFSLYIPAAYRAENKVLSDYISFVPDKAEGIAA